MESACTLRFGFNDLIKSISYTKQSNLFLHFLSTLKRSSRPWGIMSRACSYSVWQWQRIVVYVGYTHGHLHNRVKGHKHQSSTLNVAICMIFFFNIFLES